MADDTRFTDIPNGTLFRWRSKTLRKDFWHAWEHPRHRGKLPYLFTGHELVEQAPDYEDTETFTYYGWGLDDAID